MRVLLAERDALVGTAALEYLAAAGFSVTGPVESVAEASRLAQSQAWDGAVCALNLVGGRTDRILEILLERRIPVIVTTAVERATYPDCAANLMTLEKPYDLQELVEAAKRQFLPMAGRSAPA